MLLEITIAIIVAKIFNLFFQKLKQPGVIGEIFAGILLGPCCVGMLSGMSFNFFNVKSYFFQFDLTTPEFKEIALIGAIFLLFIVGLETRVDDLKKVKKAGFFVGIFAVIVPFLFGCLVGLIFRMTILQSMALGAIFNATSATITIRIFTDLDVLSTRVGLTLRSAIVLNDILAILIFAAVFGTNNSFLLLFMQIFLFFVLTIGLGYVMLRYTAKKKTSRKTPMILITSALMICFLFSLFAENMGLTAIIGAFIAGLFVGKTPQASFILEHIKTIGYIFFIPLFFVWVGSSFDFLYIIHSGQLEIFILFIIVFVSFALLGNFLGGTLGARLSGLKRRDSMSVGIGMMPIMGVALIIITTGIDRGMFGDAQGLLANQIRTATLLLIITSCLITPPLLKRSINSPFQKILGKTKLKSCSLPCCPNCVSPLRLTLKENIWYCDSCNKHYSIEKKTSSISTQQLKKKKEKQDKLLYYLVGAFTFIICGLEIQNLSHATEPEKLVAILGVLIGILFCYLVIKYYRRLIKQVSWVSSGT
ncbi:MAG: cation:proton antiporter [Candidatus Thermoplasmatota archaeon]|nr:cation:proton antiporter [Candidatus Thermoplasmatota archaeon]